MKVSVSVEGNELILEKLLKLWELAEILSLAEIACILKQAKETGEIHIFHSPF